MKAVPSIRNPKFLILLIFTLVSVVVAVGGYLLYNFRKEILREERLNELKAIADLKRSQIIQWKDERMEDAYTITNNPFVRKNLENVFLRTDSSFLPVISDYIRQIREEFGYQDISLISAGGTSLFSTNPDQVPGPSLISRYLALCQADRNVQFSGFEQVNDSVRYLNLLSPCYNKQKLLGFFLLQLDPQKYLFPLIQLWPTPSTTSETLIVSKENDSIVFLNELRHRPHSSFRMKVPLTESQIPAVMAVNGRRGFAEGVDYRGHPVIAFLSGIEGTDWFLVAKTDTEEIFEPIRSQTIIIIGSFILFLIFIGIISYLLFRHSVTAYFIKEAGETLGLRSAEQISARKRYEEQIIKLDRLYSTLLNVNHAIVRAENKEQMFRDVCRIIIDDGGYRMVSISQVVDGEVVMVSSYGYVEGYFDRIRITADESPTGMGPTGKAVRTLKNVVCQDISNDPLMLPWRDEAISRGYRSSAAFPVITSGRVACVVSIYSDVPHWFDEKEILLLDQMVIEMAYALEFYFLEHKHVEIREELEASEERFRKVFNSMNDGVAIHRLLFNNDGIPEDYRIVDVNPMFEMITSIPARLAVNALASQLYEAKPAPFLDIYSKVALTGIPHVFEVFFAPMKKHFRISVFSQESNGFTTIFQDISEQVMAREYLKKMNEELEKRVSERTAMLEAANRELETFAYSVSHDLKAPLRSISGFSYILQDRYRNFLDQEGQHYLQNIIQAGVKMQNLIEDLLRYSRLGQVPQEFSPIDLLSVLGSCLSDLYAHIESSGAIVKLPEKTTLIPGSPLLLTQAFTNLIQNAITYQPPGQRPCVEVTWEGSEDHLVLSIKDNGIGIDRKFHQKVFNIFQRLHTDDEFPGTGIGLAIVKKAVELMKGEVWIAQSEKGSGTVFCLKFLKYDAS